MLTVLFTLACTAADLPSIAEATKGFEARPGLLTTYVSAKKGTILLKIGPADKSGLAGEYLYTESLATGLGSNDLGIDRTQIGETQILDLKVFGNRVFFVVPNLQYRATTPNPDEKIATAEGFAPSVIWSADAIAEDADGSKLIDVTPFAVRDSHHVGLTLKGYNFDEKKSFLEPDKTKAFPENLEFQALVTFSTSERGELVGNHAADPQHVSLEVRQSIVKLPDTDYQARKFDPRAGTFAISYLDFSTPVGQPLTQMFATRHRLEKTDPTLPVSPVKKPIVYYVDRGVPEPMRSALVEGGNYWRKAFEAAGFKDAYRVEVMPEGIDPLDSRYNVVMWMNRSTRGYAYGQTVTDPRTGEIIKGAVNLDSQRVRQDIRIFESLVGAKMTGNGSPHDPIQIALQRTRQLAAHEIGHTLGFAHNFAASTYGRASVMDYPSPMIDITPDGKLDFSHAYATGIGDWDMQAVRWLYSEFPAAKEAANLEGIIRDSINRHLLFLSDEDATEATGANPKANRWDNGVDPIAGLRKSLRIREIAMRQFGEENIAHGQPLSQIELVFGPLYFFHRYDIDSVAKMVGGVHYVHAVRGDGQKLTQAVAGDRQRAALNALLDCLEPTVLEVPDRIAQLMGPRPVGYEPSVEEFSKSTQYTFDSLAAAESATQLVVARLTNPARCARMIELSARDPKIPTIDEVLNTLVNRSFSLKATSSMHRAIERSVQQTVATGLMDLAASSAPARVVSSAKLSLMTMIATHLSSSKDPWRSELRAQIQRFLSSPLTEQRRPAPPLPALPGAPIGSRGGF